MSLLRILPFFFAALLSAQAVAQAPPAAPAASGEENSHYGWADVLRVDPIYGDDSPSPPPQPCYEEQVPVDTPADAEVQNKRGVFTAIGAFVGGILGNQFGKGNGRAAATVAGAVAGGVAGNNIATAGEENGDSRPQYKTVRHCPPAAASQRKVVAYDVEYRYRGDVYSSRMAFDPGDRLRVKVNVTPAE
ncbi:MAG TPA: glycine zipper 2TM domain-containing protein [Rudaea sp.]|nr:glycine zipper 2TM domain-containing protein [Rudaea sp.]